MWETVVMSSHGVFVHSGPVRQEKQDIRMIHLSNMTYCNCGEPLKHNPQSHTDTHTHTHTETNSLSLPLCIHGWKQWHYPFISASNQRSLHSPQLPWRLRSEWYSCIPGNITVAAKTIPEDHKKTCGTLKCLRHCLVYLHRKNNNHISLTTGGHFQTKCRPMSIWQHFN